LRAAGVGARQLLQRRLAEAGAPPDVGDVVVAAAAQRQEVRAWKGRK